MNAEERITLDNGFEIRWWDTDDPIISANLVIHYGSLNDRPGEEGLAHFLEHCLAVGGAPGFTPEQDRAILKSKLGHANWTTGTISTIAEGSFLPQRLPLFLEYTAAHALTPAFDPVAVEQERRAILRETADRRSHTHYERRCQVRDAIYRGHPCVREGLGNETVVANATIDDLRAIHARGYCPANMTLLLAGPRPDDAIARIEDLYGKVAPGASTRITDIADLLPIEQARVFRFPVPANGHDAPTASVTLSAIMPPDGSPQEAATSVLAAILNRHDRLNESLRVGSGIAYGVSASMDSALRACVLSINSNVDARRVDEALVRIVRECNRLQEELVSSEELEDIRYRSLYTGASNVLRPSEKVAAMLYEIKYGTPYTAYFDDICNVTAQQVRDVAQQYLPRTLEERHVTTVWEPTST